MELNFTKQEGGWVSEFEVSADFNLHIEGVAEGKDITFKHGDTSVTINDEDDE